MPAAFCPACGAPGAQGNFCSTCGAPLAPAACPACGAPLSPGARFCHLCGEAAGGRLAPSRERSAWLVAATSCVALLGVIIWWVLRDAPAPEVPDMANPGSAGAAQVTPGPSGTAPDISSMSRREQFDRLYNRVSSAAASGDSAQVVMFLPMALGAYARLDTMDASARFQAAILYLGAGQDDAARALADSMSSEGEGVLYADAIRGTVADVRGDHAAARRSYRDFLAKYDAELRAHATQYAEHLNELADFRIRAQAALSSGS